MRQESVFNSYDGTELYFQKWSPENPATQSKAIVIGVHGLGEHSECYGYLAEALISQGFSFTMFDHRGHGRSEGKRGVGTIDEFALDLKVFVNVVKENFPNKPFFFFGHSMGGLVTTKYLIRNGIGGAKGVALCSPFFGVAVQLPAWKKKSAGVLSKVLPNMTLANEIPFKNLSHDPEVIKFYERDHLRHDRASSGLYISMLESIDYVFKNSDKFPTPAVFQIAGEDRVVNRADTEKFFKQILGSDKQLIIYENYFHELYNEAGRQKYFDDLVNWLNKKV